MLYLTTRTKSDAYTSHHALYEDRGPDGGYYTPFRIPSVDLETLKEKSFCSVVSDILALFFYNRITFWDVEYCIGKRPSQIIELPQNLMIVQLWHKESKHISALERSLYGKLCGGYSEAVPSWPKIAIRIAFLFAVFADLRKAGHWEGQALDIAIPVESGQTLMAVWYARQMGLPVGDILCGCGENSAVWDLMNIGEVRMQNPGVNTSLDEMREAFPEELERLIYCTMGQGEVARFLQARESGSVYIPGDGKRVRGGIRCTVVSDNRAAATVNGLYRSTGCIAGPYTAISYCAVQDHRAKSGGNRPTLILADKSPLHDGRITAKALRVSQDQLAEMLR